MIRYLKTDVLRYSYVGSTQSCKTNNKNCYRCCLVIRLNSVNGKIKIAVASSLTNQATMQLEWANNVTLTPLRLQ